MFISFRCTAQRFDVYVHYKVLTTGSVVTITIQSYHTYWLYFSSPWLVTYFVTVSLQPRGSALPAVGVLVGGASSSWGGGALEGGCFSCGWLLGVAW